MCGVYNIIEDEKERAEWNDYVEENFDGLDDVDYYRYDEPIVNSDKWLKCDYDGGYFKDIDELIQGQKQYLKYFLERSYPHCHHTRL